MTFIAEVFHRLACIFQQTVVERRLGPGAGDHFGPALGADAFGIHLDPVVDAFLGDEAFFDKEAFQSLDPEGRVRGQVAVQLAVDVFDFLGVKAGHGG